MSLATNPINTPQDLIGKKVGVQAVNQTGWDALLEINGIDPGQVTTIPADFDPTPLINGEVDGWYSFSTNEPNLIRYEGTDVATMLLADYGFALYQQIVICTGESLTDAAKRDRVLRGLRAEVKGWQYNIANPAVGVDLTINTYGADLGLDEEPCTAENHDQILLVQSDVTAEKGLFYMGEDEIAANVATLGLLGFTVDPAVYTNELLDEIYADGIQLI
jgi:hypothetical protein